MLTLRSLRSQMSRGKIPTNTKVKVTKAYFRYHFYFWPGDVLHTSLPCSGPLTTQVVDRWITEFGPDWPTKERPKQTQEVAPTVTESTDDKHGGDNQSGECPPNDDEEEGEQSSNETRGSAPRAGSSEGSTTSIEEGHQATASSGDGTPTPDQRGGGAGDPGEPTTQQLSTTDTADTPAEMSDAASAVSAEEGKVPHIGFGDEEEAASISSSSTPPESSSGPPDDGSRGESATLLNKLVETLRGLADKTKETEKRRWLRKKAGQIEREHSRKRSLQILQDNARSLGSEVVAALSEYLQAEEDSKKTTRVSLCSRPVFGGVNADLSRAAEAKSSRLSRRIVKALEKLIEREMGVYGEATPRISAKRLIVEMRGKSYRLGRCRKEEYETKLVVLAVDASGSCSSYSEELVQAAAQVVKSDHRVVLLVHSNGEPVESYGRLTNLVAKKEQVWALLAQKTGLLVALGDHDAAWAYEVFSRKGKVVWLHNYCASHGVSPAARCVRELWATMRQGVGSPETVLEALQQVRRMTHARQGERRRFTREPSRSGSRCA